jgi:ribosomal protein S18 acetylase RimI-like enzyme
MKIEKEVKIRLGKTKDIETLVGFNIALAIESEGINLSYDVVKKGVENLIRNKDNGFYLLAEFQGEIVGSLMVTKEWSDWRNGFFWWVQSVYVNPELRRRGIYHSMYEYVKRLSDEESDVLGFRLYVEKNNFKAIETYKALGMIETHYRLFEELK